MSCSTVFFRRCLAPEHAVLGSVHLARPVHRLSFGLRSHGELGPFLWVFVETQLFHPPTLPEYPKNSPGKTTLLSIGQIKLKQLLYLTENTSCCHDNLCSKIRNASHSGVAAIKRTAQNCLSIHRSSAGELGAPAQPSPPTLQPSFWNRCGLQSGVEAISLWYPPIVPTFRLRGFCPVSAGSPSL